MAVDKLQWEIFVPIFKNRFIVKDLLFAIGIPFGILITFILIISRGDVFGTDAKYALALIGLLFLFTFIAILVIYGGKYAPGFILDEKGITNYTQAAQVKKNKVINGLLIALGLFSGNPTAVGTGIAAGSRQVVHLNWSQIRMVRYYPRQHSIIVRAGWTEKLAVFCTKENYASVETIIKERVNSQN